tara:strand:+ start:59 stop:706 length:648 start_codon:yes stop_codon:yes gene_type:complete
MNNIIIVLTLVIFVAGCASNSQSPQNLNWTGNEAYFKNDYVGAISWYSASLEASLKSGDKQFEAISMYGLARANGHLCNLNEAETWLVKSIEVRKSLPDIETAKLSQNLFELGRLYMAKREWKKANEQYSQALLLLANYDMEEIDPLGYANLLDEYQKILENTGSSELASENHAKIERLRKNYSTKQAQYVSDPYPANCTLNKSGKSDAVTGAPS